MPAYSRYASIQEESSFGTGAGSTYLFDIAGETLQRKPVFTLQEPERLMGALAQYEQRRSAQGSLDLFTGWEGLGRVLKGVSRAPTTTSAGGGYYTHTFTPAPNTSITTWTVDIPREADTHRFTGMAAKAGRMSFGVGETHFGVSLDMIGKDEAGVGSIASVSASSFEAAMPIIGATTLTLITGATTWTGAFQSVDVNFKSGRRLIMPDRYATPARIVDEGYWEASIKVKSIYWTDTDPLLAAFRSRAALSATLAFASGSYAFSVALPACRINGTPPTIKGPGYRNIELLIDAQALLSSSINAPIGFTLTNTTSSYA